MKLGTCAGLDKFEAAAEIGYDYLESNLGVIKNLNRTQLGEAKKILDGHEIKLEATNCFFPGEIHLAGDDATTLDEIKDYTCRAFENAKLLGAETCVLGSGRTRSVPEGFDRERGVGQVLDAVRAIGEIAKEYGIRVAIEPLNSLESNIFTTVRETADTCRELGLDNVCVLADIYHMVMEKEDFSSLSYASDKLIHVHFSNPVALGATGTSKRIFPAEGDGYNYAPFVKALSDAGYDGRISIEAGCNCFETEAAEGLRMMKKLFK